MSNLDTSDSGTARRPRTIRRRAGPLVALLLAAAAGPVGVTDAAAKQLPPQAGASGPLIFGTDFEHDEVVASKKGPPSKEGTLRTHSPTGKPLAMGIFYEGGSPEDRVARVIDDPTDSGNHVLSFWIKRAVVPTGARGLFKGRIQLGVGQLELTEAYERFRLYLPPAMAAYSSYPGSNTWFTFAEFWSGALWEGEKNSFRIRLSIAKEAGVGQPLHLFASGLVPGSGKAGQKGEWNSAWNAPGLGYELPVGVWLDVAIGYRQGDRESGRFFVGVKRSDEAVMTPVLDVHDWTYHPQAPRPVPLTNWHLLKLYASGDVIDHIRNRGGVAELYFDDLQVFDRWPE